ncbi:ABC transporter substrate-binding protein [Paenibacillus sp. DMB5]|uniref:ABC transporter substrate-binding protein n=1 Tax=Paenibacillus sp. DMB5 TaxID=1780103 RepID=UPI00076C41BD|nr:ABC transporter substrate-binding protein [Paenibacillus sp. DMB5]KUP21759.1 sugar ABC transporter substrate-binding protein [Paenibacillus sp. DMB5]
MRRVIFGSISVLILAAVLLVWLSGAFRHGDLPARGIAPEAASDNPYKNEVKLTGYLIGEAPPGLPEVLRALNDKLKQDINATLELNYIAWDQLASRYSLLLESGENIDFIFAADWSFYTAEASRGAFMPLSKEMLRSYMPRHMALMPEEAFQATLVNGQSYMIPTAAQERKINLALFRKDIMAKAGLSEITAFSEIEPYLAEIKKSYPDMTPLNLDSQFDLSTPYGYLMAEQIGWPGAPFDSGDPSAQGIVGDMDRNSGELWSMVEEPMLSVQKNAARIMKDWYDKGYVNRNPFANQVRSKENFCYGKSGIAFGNSNDLVQVFTLCREKGIEVYPFPMLYPSGTTSQSSWLNNGVAISANSRHPERALQALDLIMQEPSYAYLAYYGIEGLNYTIESDGRIGLPEGVSAESNTYPPDASGFWFVNKELFPPMAVWTDSYAEMREQIDGYLKPTTYLGFLFNSGNVKTEIANLKSISIEYAQPIYIGAVEDVDTAFVRLAGQLKAAGIDKVKAEAEKQAAAFLQGKQ